MQQENSHIALVLFTRTPDLEARAKNLVPQGTISHKRAIAEKLIKNSDHLLAATGLNYFIFSTNNQAGNSFGERLYQVFATLFNQGYEQVLVIGNDCPQLKPNDILVAAQYLNQQPVVVGPDAAGGVYLLGLTRHAFHNKTGFLKVRWNTRWVLRDLLRVFNLPPETLRLLPVYTDINNYQALLKALRQPFYIPAFKNFIRHILSLFLQPVIFSFPNLFTRFLLPGWYFRGPPIFF